MCIVQHPHSLHPDEYNLVPKFFISVEKNPVCVTRLQGAKLQLLGDMEIKH